MVRLGIVSLYVSEARTLESITASSECAMLYYKRRTFLCVNWDKQDG